MHNLVQGIHKFQADHFEKEFFEELADGQHPVALFITCSDSRIDPNLLTQTKPGEIFILRTAGNIVPPYGAVVGGEAATIEYAVSALKVPHIIVCGHSHCGAMTGLLELSSLGEMPAVQSYLGHAESCRRIVNDSYADVRDKEERIRIAIKENVLVQLENLRTHPSVASALRTNKVELHGWVYQFESGDVSQYNPSSEQFELIRDVDG